MKKFFMFLARTFKTTRGNWYKPNRWSDCARRLRDSGARRISRGDKTSRLDVAVKNITNDLYWGVFPGKKGRAWRNNPDMIYYLEKEVRTLIERLNSYDLYLDWYSGELWLVKFHCSMPVGKFLAYFKGSNDTAQRYVNDALSEWTGMDEEEINDTYEKLIMLMRHELICEHRGMSSLLYTRVNVNIHIGAVVRPDLAF